MILLFSLTHVAYASTDGGVADRVQPARDRRVRVPLTLPRKGSRRDGRANVVHQRGSGHCPLGEHCGQIRHDDGRAALDGVGDVSLEDDSK